MLKVKTLLLAGIAAGTILIPFAEAAQGIVCIEDLPGPCCGPIVVKDKEIHLINC